MNWQKYFVEKKPRNIQGKILDEVFKDWDKYDNIIIEAPTGVGKSAIAMTIARTLFEERKYKSYITTTSIELQEQYMKSYSSIGLRKLYSSSNFTCNRKHPMSCKEGMSISNSQKSKCPGKCPYRIQKDAFKHGSYGILNLAYYLYERNYVNELGFRDICLFDEAHTVGDSVKEFCTITISEYHLKALGIKCPKPNDSFMYSIKTIKNWVETEYIPRLQRKLSEIIDEIEEFEGSLESKAYLSLLKRHSEMAEKVDKMNSIIEEMETRGWVAEYIKNENCIKITPLSPRTHIKEKLLDHNGKNIFLSATILDSKFLMNEYNMDSNKTKFLTCDSPFPLKNRPIFILPSGKINFNDLESSISDFVNPIKHILNEHKSDRGIIFVSSYAQAHELIRQVNDSRLITHTSSKDKQYMMETHKTSKNTVIVSPTMHEGVDLKDDLSRFQIIIKMPFASLGSASIKKRSEIYPEWYAYKTCLSLIQSTGRSVRNENDKAITYILDNNFTWFYKKWKKFFPYYWQKAINYVSK